MNAEPLHLLIVEDEEAHAEAIRRAFEAAGGQTEIRVARTLREYGELIAEMWEQEYPCSEIPFVETDSDDPQWSF